MPEAPNKDDTRTDPADTSAPATDGGESDDPVGDEPILGDSAPGQAASEAIRALARCARSFLIYDAGNNAIRHFLEEMRAKWQWFFDRHGDLAVLVRPWEMVLDKEVVYLERDRERSLAFRLYRDGVRRLRFKADTPWEELTRFLGILSVRFTGIRLQEDDIVTLLWKAGFHHIEIDAVEGLVPEDDEAAAEISSSGKKSRAKSRTQAVVFDAPYQFDYPWPEFEDRVAVALRKPTDETLAKLAAEDSSQALPHQCVQLLAEVLEAMRDPFDAIPLVDAMPLIREIRDFLLSEGFIEALVEVVHLITEHTEPEDEEATRQTLLDSFAGEEAMRRIIHTVRADETAAPQELNTLIDLVPGDHGISLLNILGTERTPASRAVACDLLRRLMVGDVPRLRERIHVASDAPVICDMLVVLADIDVEAAIQVAADLVTSKEPEIQFECLRILEPAAYSPEIGRALTNALMAPSEEVRLRALRLLVLQRETRSFDKVVTLVQERSSTDLQPLEGTALGEAMTHLNTEEAMGFFKSWVKPPKFLFIFSRPQPGQTMLRWCAVAGLALVPGDDAEKLLRWLAKRAGAELYQHCMKALARQRRLEAPDG